MLLLAGQHQGTGKRDWTGDDFFWKQLPKIGRPIEKPPNGKNFRAVRFIISKPFRDGKSTYSDGPWKNILECHRERWCRRPSRNQSQYPSRADAQTRHSPTRHPFLIPLPSYLTVIFGRISHIWQIVSIRHWSIHPRQELFLNHF